MSYFNYTDDQIKDGGAGFKVGPYGFKIVKSEDSPTKAGDPRLNIDIDLFDLSTKEKVGKGIRYISFNVKHEIGQSQLAALLKVAGMTSLEKPSDLVGKGGVVLVGYEQDYKDDSKCFPKPAFGGFGCWFNKEKLSATEIKDGATESKSFMERLSALIEAPYRGQDGQMHKDKPSASAPEQSTDSTPENEESDPF